MHVTSAFSTGGAEQKTGGACLSYEKRTKKRKAAIKKAQAEKFQNPESVGSQTMSEAVFCERLRKLREEKRISRAALSELCGMEKGAVRRYERGERIPSLPALMVLADFFEVSLDYLTGRASFR